MADDVFESPPMSASATGEQSDQKLPSSSVSSNTHTHTSARMLIHICILACVCAHFQPFSLSSHLLLMSAGMCLRLLGHLPSCRRGLVLLVLAGGLASHHK